MRKCQDCLHYSGEKIVLAGVDVTAEYCSKNIFCIPLEDSMLRYFGCDDFWPKDGAKCETCRFGSVDEEFDDTVLCHLSKRSGTHVKDWYCEEWRAKE